MEQYFFNDNNRRTSTITMPTNNQIAKDSYEYELMRLMERERQMMTAQVRIFYSYFKLYIFFLHF
jgi:hypothetical protein